MADGRYAVYRATDFRAWFDFTSDFSNYSSFRTKGILTANSEPSLLIGPERFIPLILS